MTLSYTIRPVTEQDVPFLWDMLYESIYVPEGHPTISRDILNDPAISKYVEGWGRKGDVGYIALDEAGKALGSITARIFEENSPGHGYVDEETPELGMALLEQYRGKGLGTALMRTLLDELRRQGIRQVSLSVDPNNYAVKLYRKFGFEEIGICGTSITMVGRL